MLASPGLGGRRFSSDHERAETGLRSFRYPICPCPFAISTSNLLPHVVFNRIDRAE